MYPSIKTYTTFKDIMDIKTTQKIPSIIEEMCYIPDRLAILDKLQILPFNIVEMIIEGSLLAQLLEKQTQFRDFIVDMHKAYYMKLENGGYLHWYRGEDDIRYLRPDAKLLTDWTSCNEDWCLQEVEKHKKSSSTQLVKSPIGYYGLYNSTSGDFCIRRILENQPTKKNKDTSGKQCTTWMKKELLPMIYKIKDLPFDTSIRRNISVENLRYEMKATPNMTSSFTNAEIDEMSIDDMKRLLYWNKKNIKDETCGALKVWFENNGLMGEDKGCGSHSKKKPVN
jgi:hypothetical protein